jgi:hypothetical protein
MKLRGTCHCVCNLTGLDTVCSTSLLGPKYPTSLIPSGRDRVPSCGFVDLLPEAESGPDLVTGDSGHHLVCVCCKGRV